jgi:hypothetical protein
MYRRPLTPEEERFVIKKWLGWLILLVLAQVVWIPWYAALWYWAEYRNEIHLGTLLVLVGLALVGWVFERDEVAK